MVKRKIYKWQDVIHRMKNSFYVNRWGMHLAEIESINVALNGYMIDSKKELLLLASFNFDVEPSLERYHPTCHRPKK